MSPDRIVAAVLIVGASASLLLVAGLCITAARSERAMTRWTEATDDPDWSCDVDQAMRLAHGVDRGLDQLQPYANRGSVGRKDEA